MKLRIGIESSTKNFKKTLEQIGKAQKQAVFSAMGEGLRRAQSFVVKETTVDTPLKKGRGKGAIGSRAYIKVPTLLKIKERLPLFVDQFPFTAIQGVDKRGRKVGIGVKAKIKGKTIYYPNAKVFTTKKGKQIIIDANHKNGKRKRLRFNSLQNIFIQNSSVQKLNSVMLIEFNKALIKATSNELRKIKK